MDEYEYRRRKAKAESLSRRIYEVRKRLHEIEDTNQVHYRGEERDLRKSGEIYYWNFQIPTSDSLLLRVVISIFSEFTTYFFLVLKPFHP